jgi:peptidyl-tRNA hydrolase, PTH1 family
MFKLGFRGKTKKDKEGTLLVDGRRVSLIAGLGNPGDKYKNTYHNAGFLFMDMLGGEVDAPWKKLKSFQYKKLGNITLIKPLVLMNRSGIAIKEAMHYFNVHSSELLLAHDDSDIQLGSYKISFGRGSAGHNGVGSVIKYLGMDDFLRLRIGIRNGDQKAGEFVLKKISENELPLLNQAIKEAGKTIKPPKTL